MLIGFIWLRMEISGGLLWRHLDSSKGWNFLTNYSRSILLHGVIFLPTGYVPTCVSP
jgi:hypothetical protein